MFTTGVLLVNRVNCGKSSHKISAMKNSFAADFIHRADALNVDLNKSCGKIIIKFLVWRHEHIGVSAPVLSLH